MTKTQAISALRQYGRVGAVSGVAAASPHRLIQMLMEGALSRIALAAGQMRRGEVAEKGRNIGLAISIIDGLRASLDAETGGEIAANLDALYEYMTRTLLRASVDGDPAPLDDVHGLLGSIKEGWDAIPERVASGEPVPERRVGAA